MKKETIYTVREKIEEEIAFLKKQKRKGKKLDPVANIGAWEGFLWRINNIIGEEPKKEKTKRKRKVKKSFIVTEEPKRKRKKKRRRTKNKGLFD